MGDYRNCLRLGSRLPIYLDCPFWRTLTKIDMTLREYLERLKPALNGSITMAAAVLAVKWVVPTARRSISALLVRFPPEPWSTF